MIRRRRPHPPPDPVRGNAAPGAAAPPTTPSSRECSGGRFHELVCHSGYSRHLSPQIFEQRYCFRGEFSPIHLKDVNAAMRAPRSISFTATAGRKLRRTP
jgi:hypothetical protein